MGSASSANHSNFFTFLRHPSCVSMAVVIIVVAALLFGGVQAIGQESQDVKMGSPDVKVDHSGELNINLDAANETAFLMQNYLVGLATTLTGVGFMEEYYQTRSSSSGVSVNKRSSSDMANMIAVVRDNMATVLQEKEKAVRELKTAAEEAMKQNGPQKEVIDFEEVDYFNAKKVVIDSDLQGVAEEYRPKIKGTIDYMPTDIYWEFGKHDHNLRLNSNTSTVHVPTNIYDKSMKILNGVRWTEKLTLQFIENSQRDPTLTWQYFCSSDGFFRVYPGMQWPRDPEKVDVFDCRMRKWYIQAASTPKNIIILLDTSGSMTGERLTIAQSTVSTILDTLSDQDYFNIIKFSKVPEYVDPCFKFNGTLIPANIDNIQRMQEKIQDIKTEDQANLRDALMVAFQLFAEEEKPGSSTVCNKAIMIITDGAPENYVDVFNSTNWPDKATRIFTFLIGKEVSDDRKVKWMACVNKGKFTHISTKADVKENVQQYIRMLSRPLAQNKSNHHIWSAVYLDYSTDQSDIKIQPYSSLKDRIDAAYEDFAEFKGLGLVISFAMPVYDTRTKVAKWEEDPEKNLLGVVGTDVRINDLIKLIPTYKLGVNGYAFAVTNHGYVLFHPDYRPFYFKDRHEYILKLRPKYNSVDLSELELPYDQMAPSQHPLRQYLLTAQEGSNNKTVTMLTHFDGMNRVKLQKNHYQFTAVDSTFRLVFVLPENYGDKYLKVDKEAAAFTEEEIKTRTDYSGSHVEFAPWIYCKDKNGKYMQMNADVFYLTHTKKQYICDEDQFRHLLFDLVHTTNYADQWSGSRYNPDGRKKLDSHAVKRRLSDNPARAQCLLPDNEWSGPFRALCIQELYKHYGIDMVWVGTASGLTRYKFTDHNKTKEEPDKRYTGSIRNLYYRRAVFGWEEGLLYVFFLDSSKDSELQVIMSAAEVVGEGKNKMPVAVTAFRMRHEVFAELFRNNTGSCPRGDCPFTCANSDMLNCYLIDDNGYIMASNDNQTKPGKFLGKIDPALMRELIHQGYFMELNLTDYQAMCEEQRTSQGSSSNFIRSPFHWLAKILLWIFSEMTMFLSEWGIVQWITWPFSTASADDYFTEGYDISKECEKQSSHLAPQVRYYLCNIVIFESSNQLAFQPVVSDLHTCIESMTRYTLNTTTVKAKKRFNGSLTDCGNCNASQLVSYTVHWLEPTNLIMVMAAANCECAKAEDAFNDERFEMEFTEQETCQRLFNISKELKRVDSTRDPGSLCLDSRNEEDYPCGHSPVHKPSLVLSFSLLTFFTWSKYC